MDATSYAVLPYRLSAQRWEPDLPSGVGFLQLAAPDGGHRFALYALETTDLPLLRAATPVSGPIEELLRRAEMHPPAMALMRDAVVHRVLEPHARHDRTPLYYAACRGQLEAACLLIDEGADVCATFYPNVCVLSGGIKSGNPEIVRELIKRGALLRTAKFDAIMAAVDYDSPMVLPILIPATLGVPPVFRWAPFLGEDRLVGEDPLGHAVRLARTHIVQAFLQAHVDPNGMRRDLEVAPIEWAALLGRREILRLLLEAGADREPLEKVGPDGLTALDRAERRGWADIAEMLGASTPR